MLNISLLWLCVSYNTVTNIITVLEVFKKKLDGNNLFVLLLFLKKEKLKLATYIPRRGLKTTTTHYYNSLENVSTQ